MKVLILGGNGMIGHYLLNELKQSLNVKASLKNDKNNYSHLSTHDEKNYFFNVNALNLNSIKQTFSSFRPDVVINAIGITKKLIHSIPKQDSIIINSLFPHQLSNICENFNSRLILFSSDCVFSGDKGNYKETDETDPRDIYGLTKKLGEIALPNVITIRKSTIGLEISNSHGLIEWFLSQRGEVKGFKNAIYSGLITAELARFIKNLIINHQDLSGIYHLSSNPIDKYSLLTGLNDRLKFTHIFIKPDNTFTCDRTLNMEKLNKVSGYVAPTWGEMLDELTQEIIKKNKRKV